jgi:2-dehydro-3-deoxygluconokinase
MKPDVTIVGDINVDIKIPPLQIYPEKDRQVIVPNMYLTTGGSACNTAIACSRLGLKTRFIGKLGGDNFSKFLLKSLKDIGVETKIKISKKEKTGVTFALTVKDSRSFITYKGTNNTLKVADIPLKYIEGKVFVLSGYNLLNDLRKDAEKLFEYAKKNKMITALDPNWDPNGWTKERIEDINKLLEFTNWFFPDLEEGKAISLTEKENLILGKLAMFGPEIVCLKLGDNGCLLGEKDKKQLIDSFHVKSVNPTGSGDVFLAGFIKEILDGKSPEQAVKFANAAAALSITTFGLERYPKTEQVEKFMKGVNL